MSMMNINTDIGADMQQFLRSMVDQGIFHNEAEVVEEPDPVCLKLHLLGQQERIKNADSA